MRLPRLDVVFRATASAIDVLVEDAGIARFQIGDDEARVGPFSADFDAGDDALDTAPTPGGMPKFLEAANLAVLGRRLEAGFRAGLQRGDARAQCRGRRHAENIIEALARQKSSTSGPQ
jgi:hypothetical protein